MPLPAKKSPRTRSYANWIKGIEASYATGKDTPTIVAPKVRKPRVRKQAPSVSIDVGPSDGVFTVDEMAFWSRMVNTAPRVSFPHVPVVRVAGD
jgi:hypothetical protein